MDLSPVVLLAIAAAAVAAGIVNAVAGGGTLITFPTLTAAGLPATVASITNTVALSPGYLGGTMAQRTDLAGQRARLIRLVPAGMLGGVTGGVLLLVTSESIFRRLVPFLILMACALLAGQDRIRAWVIAREQAKAAARTPIDTAGPVALRPSVGAGTMAIVYVSSIYGGYFGAGLGIILLAVLGVLIDDEFRRINALKQSMSLTINTTAAVFFLFSGRIVWSAAAAMAVGSLAGGAIGGRVATMLDPVLLRRVVIVIGVVVAIVYFVR